MNALQIILLLALILISSLYTFNRIIRKFLQKKGFEVSFSINGFLSLKNLKIKILKKCLEKYFIIGRFELVLSKFSIRIQSWKLKIVLNEIHSICYILNHEPNQMKERNRHHHHHQQQQQQQQFSSPHPLPSKFYSRLQNQLSRNITIENDNNIGIIRNLMLIVTIQIIARIISFELENIQFKFYIIDCKCIQNHKDLKINQNGICEKCGIQMKYGIYSQLEIQNLNIFPKAYLGGIMIHFLFNHFALYFNPIENTISEKRCHTFYLDSNNQYHLYSKNESSILNYILKQYQLKSNQSSNQIKYPPFIYINNNLNITMKLMHSISGSDIRVCILRNMNIEMNQFWLTLIPEITCELIYIFYIIKTNYKKSNKGNTYNKNIPQVLDPNLINQSDPIIKLSPKYQLLNNNTFPSSPIPLIAPPSSPNISSISSSHSPIINFDDKVSKTKQKLIMNENLDRQLQINFKISQPSIIFCDNTQSSSGFEILFHEFEAHLIIQYFIEYLESNLKLYNQDCEIDHSNSDHIDFNFMNNDPNQNYIDNDILKKNTRSCLKVVFGSKLIFGNSILYLNKKENLPFSNQIMPNTIKDGDFIFDRMFVIEHYKSNIEISDNNFVKLYFKNSIQRMFGFWKENGFYQNLTLFLQLIKFQKYLSKIKNQVNNNNNNYNSTNEKPSIKEENEEIPKIPLRIELEDSDILKSDFLIKNNKYLKEIMTIKDFAVKLLFYFEIKQITIQTNNISCFNHELMNLKKNDSSNCCYCEDCFVESFGPKERFDWTTDFDSNYKNVYQENENENEYNSEMNPKKNLNNHQFFILRINNLKLCNTSLNRSFSMLFSDVNLSSMNEFVDLEDISIKHLNLANHFNQNLDILDFQKICIYRYGCFDQRTQAINFEISSNTTENNQILRLNESIIISPWDLKKISLRFKQINGNLETCYVPLYLYITGCFNIDSLALKKSNLSKVYYGINNQFEENFDFYCKERTNYFEKFDLIKKELLSKFHQVNDSLEFWTIPDLIQSKIGSLKYTWYFDFDDINIKFLNDFKLLINQLSIYRCNEYGNYDIKMNNVKIFDIFGINILDSNMIRMRSDIPFKSVKIKSPICLKKQLRRILDLSINGDLLLLSILGNRENSENNWKDINNGMIFFDSKRFILEIDQLDILILVNSHYREFLFKYLYQYVYITFYQLFHPALIIRTGKLLSFSRPSPIVFSCNNIFDFAITKMNISLSNLANFMSPQEYEGVDIHNYLLKIKRKKCSKDDLSVQYDNVKLEDLSKRELKSEVNNILSFPISKVKFDLLRLKIRTKHTSNSKSECNDKECYYIPNNLTNSVFSEEGFLINSSYNPINVFVILMGFSVKLFNQIKLNNSSSIIQSRKEVSISSENIAFDFRRNYSRIDDNNNNNIPELSSDTKISIYSKSKSSIHLSNFHSTRALKFLKPLLELINNSSNFKLKFKKNECKNYLNEFKNAIISKNTLTLSILTSDLTSLNLAPYINIENLTDMNDNSSVYIQLPKIEFFLKRSCHSNDQANNNNNNNNFLNQIESASLLLNQGINVRLISKEIFAPLTRRRFQNQNSSNLNSVKQRYYLKNTLLSLSKININIQRIPENCDLDVKITLNGLNKDSVLKRHVENDLNRSDSHNIQPLTLNLDYEKLIQFSTILESFLDEHNFQGISLNYCQDCNRFRPIKLLISSESQKDLNSQENINNQTSMNVLLNISLNYINLRFEIFNLLINHVLVELDYLNSKMARFILGIKETQLIAEYFPYKLSQFSKSSFSLKVFHGSSIQLTSNFSWKTKMLEIARIGNIMLKTNNDDSILLILRSPQISLSNLTFTYLEVWIKLLNRLKSKSDEPIEFENSSPNLTNNSLFFPLIPKKKLNIQISEIMINMNNLGTNREFKLQKDDRKIRLRASYTGAKKIYCINDLENQSDLLHQIIEENPIYNSFTLVDDLEESNANLSIFQSNNSESCVECNYNLNKPLIYSSRICTEYKGENFHRGNTCNKLKNCPIKEAFKKYCNDYFSLLDDFVISNKYQKSRFEMIQVYKNICLYTENNITFPLEYGQIIEYMVIGELGFGRKAEHTYFSRNFTQIISKIPRIDCSVGINDDFRKFEFVLKTFPISIDIFLSNRLIWDLFEDSANQPTYFLENSLNTMKEDSKIPPEIPENYLSKLEEAQFCDNNSQSYNHYKTSSEIPNIPEKNSCETFVGTADSSTYCSINLEETQLGKKRSLNESSQEILKTTPIFVSIRVHTEKPSTQLKMYSRLLSVSIDSCRVQSINEILYSFESRYINTNKSHNHHNNNNHYHQQQQNGQSSNNISNPSILSGLNSTTLNNNSINVSSIGMNSVTGGNLPPPIYYSHNFNTTNNTLSCAEQTQTLSSHTLPQGFNSNIYSAAKTPSVLSFSSFLHDQKQDQGQRINIMNLISLNNYPSINSLETNPNKILSNGDLSEKNVSNMLKFEIDKYLADNPLFYTVVDNVQYQAGGDNNQLIHYKFQIECIIDQLNVNMFINDKRFSNFQSKDINFVMFSNNDPSISTIIEFDSSFIHLSANKDFIQSNGSSNTNSVASNSTNNHNSNNSNNHQIGGYNNSNPSGNPNNFFNSSTNDVDGGNVSCGSNLRNTNNCKSLNNSNSLSIIDKGCDLSSQEEVSIIHPMYIDGHTSQGHGHVLSIRINMRQVRLLEIYNIRILESVVIRVHPIRVNITQYLTSCYYNIFFPPPTSNQPSMVTIQTSIQSQEMIFQDSDTEANSPKIQENNSLLNGTSQMININSNNDITLPTLDNENLYLSSTIQQPNNSSEVTHNVSSKNILYFNYLRMSSILVEVTYRGSVSLNNVLLELSSFTQRRKHRSVKEMVDKYISFLRRQAARPVISYTFKQLKHSLLPKHFKSHKRSGNFNSQYNDIIQSNIQSNNNNFNENEQSSKLNSSFQDILTDTGNNGIFCKYNNNNSSIFSKIDDDVPNTFSRKIQNSNYSKNDSEYNKFKLIFGNQLLI